jgi:hypothetical protein
VIAVDAGPMQIQWWEGAALSRAETVLQGTTHDTVRAENGCSEKVSQRLWSKKVEEGIGLTARHRDTERPEGGRVFELERVVSCRSADRWWRTKLDLESLLKSVDELAAKNFTQHFFGKKVVIS